MIYNLAYTYKFQLKTTQEFDLGNADTIVNDICILELDLDFDFNGNVSTIELNTNEVILDPTSSCTIAGWGSTNVSIDKGQLISE